MRKILGLLSIFVTATLLLFTNDTTEFMFILYILVLYLGNSFLVSDRENNDLVPLLTCTELFYIFDFYLLINNMYGSLIFCFLAVAFSLLCAVCIIKERKSGLPKVEIKDEEKRYDITKKISLACLILALAFNVVLLGLIDYNSVTSIYPLVMLIMTLLMTVVIIYQGFIAGEVQKNKEETKPDMLVVSALAGNVNTFSADNKNDLKYKKRFISNRPYFILSIFYLLFLPSTLHDADNLMRILYPYFFLYILIVMYYPLAKCEFYGFRKNDSKYRLGWLDHFKKSFVYNFIFLLCGLTLSLSLYYVHNGRLNNSSTLKIYEHDATVSFSESDRDMIELEVRKKYQDVVYIALEENNNEKISDYGEKYKQILVYAYTDDSNEVYVYTYRKYTTKSADHELGEVKEYGYRNLADFEKDEIENLKLNFS